MLETIQKYRNKIEYLSNLSRYWIEQGEWDMANIYIDKVVTIQNLYDMLVKVNNTPSPEEPIKYNQTLIIEN